MTSPSRDPTKLRLYRAGVNALHGLGSSQPWLYACPICATALGWDALVDGRLTFEHVPPASVGGRPICLTCKACNNRAGSALEHHLAKRGEVEAFVRALGGEGEVEAHDILLVIDDLEHRMEVTTRPDEPIEIVGIERINAPGATDRLRQRLDELAASGAWDGLRIRLTSRERYDPWRVQVALLKAAFLAAFARLGYVYALHPALEAVRVQIQHPDEQRLPPFGGCLADGEPETALWHFHVPERALMVQIDRDVVFLPDIGAEEGTYERVLERREAMFDGGRAQRLTWPTAMHLELDQR